jgi:SAM-dependent methyltransferase
MLPNCESSSVHPNDCDPIILTAAEGFVEIVPLLNGRFRCTLKPRNANIYVPRASCETSLPLEIISAFLDSSFSWLCDSLARHDDPDYVRKVVGRQLFAYFNPPDFRGRRVLDFGCGSGASTFCIGEMFPETEVVGVELNPANVELARRVLAVRHCPNVQFVVSTDPNSLPSQIGTFDFVMLSAVYEHLLPGERRRVMPMIWSCMNYGGVLFVNQTPYRYFPYEHHSTGLWFINYLPDMLSLFLARNFSKMNPSTNKSRDWTVHLRGGIRGATEAEILRNLSLARMGHPTVIKPGGQDRADYWLACTGSERHRLVKHCIANLFRLTDKLWGTIPSVNLEFAIRKDPAG